MDVRQSGRKRKNSSMSNSRSQSPISCRTRQGLATAPEHAGPNQQEEPVERKPTSSTPRKPRKRVRFSDPGPQLHDAHVGSTGLTPAMRRSFEELGDSVPRAGDWTPSRRSRRRSAPTPRFQRSFDPVAPFDETCSERVMQFTPLRQILDTRTQRRIRRIGLSDEINRIEREKRETANFDKSLRTLLQERDALRHELDAIKRGRENCEGQTLTYESSWMSSMSPPARIQQLETQTGQLFDEISVPSHRNLDATVSSVNGDEDTFMLNDSAIVVSSSPDFRGIRDCHPRFSEHATADASAQAQGPDNTEESDIRALTLDLEAAREEKRELFNACRSRVATLDDPTINNIFRQSSPPPDICDKVLDILAAALSRASDATQALEGISQECSSLGFSGTDTGDVISDMRSHFRSARLELERALPGETAGVGLDDGKATLSALVRRVVSLAEDLGAERQHHHGSLGREKALRGQFDNLLHRYEAASNKISRLEESIASSASDMLHTRMRMQDLERGGQEQAVGIDRLSAALNKYREDVKSLEELVSSLEKENVSAKEQYTQQIFELKSRVAEERKQRSAVEISASERDSRIRELEETVEQNRIRACDLMAQVESLEKEHQRAVESLQQDANDQEERHQKETGTLNVRISDLTTSLEGARSEAERLRQINAGLEEQLQLEVETRNGLLDKWAADQVRSFAYMKDTVNSERRRAKVREANWELKSDELMSDGTTVAGSEPITPVSMTRFVDVEVGRGKNRRRIDSGIGILTEEELLEGDEVSELRRGLESDIDLPTLNLVDA